MTKIPMRPRWRLALGGLVCAILGCATPASAQRLFVRVGPFLGELEIGAGRVGRLAHIVDTACDATVPARTWPTDYGRMLAWNGPSGTVCLFDLLSGAATRVAAPGEIVAAGAGPFRVVLREGINTFHVLRAPGAAPMSVVVPLTIPRLGWPLWFTAIDATNDSLLLIEADVGDILHTPSMAPTLRRMSLTTGTIGPTITLAVPIGVGEVVADPAGRRLALLTGDHNGPRVAVVDAVSGAVLASSAAIPFVVPGGYTDRSVTWLDDYLLVASLDTSVAIASLELADARTAAYLGRLRSFQPRLPMAPGMRARTVRFDVDVDPVSRRLLLHEEEIHWDGSAFGRYVVRESLQSTDLATLQVAGETDLVSQYGLTAAFWARATRVLVGPPPAPAGLGVAVSGATATFTWQAVPGATHYALEAGTAPGRGDIGVVVAGQPSLTVNGVPPGRYYVRVRAVGVGGQGPRSGDIAVVVQ